MLITQYYTWPAVNWPAAAPATQYTVFQLYPGTPVVNQVVTTNAAAVTFDDAMSYVWQVRPSSSSGPTYGPEVTTYVVNYVPCRAWLRQKVRKSLSDRADVAGVSINWPDDELNEYIGEAFGEFNILYPLEENTTITLSAPYVDGQGRSVPVRSYALPADFYKIKTVEYVTSDLRVHKYLKEKTWRGGETTSTSIQGYPKLGIVLAPQSGRFYAGNYFVYENQLNIDFDPYGDGDIVNINYAARRAAPTSDGDILSLLPEDMELISLRCQMKCWLRVEGQDARLSRWRTKDDGSRRDDMPTSKHSDVIKKLYNELVNDRRELRTRSYRLVRR